MLVPSISPIEISLPPNFHAASESGGASSAIQSHGDTTRLPAAQQPKQNHPIDVRSAAGLVNSHSVSLRFKTDEVSGIRVIEVVNRETGDIVYQIPSEHIVEFLNYLKDNN